MSLRRRNGEEDGKETVRIEAFSDGVFAIAITLLVLELRFPAGAETRTDGEVLQQIWNLWPQYVALTISFAFTGIIWINHHRLFNAIRRSDHVLLLLNLLLLFGVTLLQFPTSVLAEHLGHDGEQAAAQFYGGVFLIVALLFNALWRYASGGNRLINADADPVLVQTINRRFLFGPLMYLVAFLLAFVNVWPFLALQVALATFYALPGPSHAEAQTLDARTTTKS